MSWHQIYQNWYNKFARLATSVREHTNGSGPFVLWSMMFFGGVWFPATPFLKYLFEGVKPTEVWLAPTNSFVVGQLLVFSFVFWTWTNLAGICLLASIMGEVSREWKDRTSNAHYYQAVARGFYVYLFVLLGNLAIVGNLIGAPTPIEAQAIYIRMAVLTSIFCFAASYRPQFFESLISQITKSADNDGQVTRGFEHPPARHPK